MKSNQLAPALRAHPGEAYYPLSFQQQRIWFLSQLAPANSLFNMCSWKHLQGKLDEKILAKSLETIMNRHRLFRTTFAIVKAELHQQVLSTVKVDFTRRDFPGQEPGASQKARIFLEEEARRPFDIQEDVLIRFYLVKIAENEHIFMFNWHHILTDGNSTHLLWHEIIKAYNGCAGHDDIASLTPLELHYHDYALWQGKMFARDHLQSMAAYWLKEFPGELPILNLPTDFPRPEVQSYNGSIYKYSLDLALVKELQKYNYFKMSLFSRFLAAYYILLSKYSSQDDIIIGVFFNGRHYSSDLSTMLGYLANTVAIRLQSQRNQAFTGFLRRQVTAKSIEAYNNQAYPLEEILKKINPERNPGRPPLFQVMFNLQTELNAHDAFAGLEEKEYNPHVDVSASQYELTLFIYQAGDTIQLNFEYCVDLFKRETIERMALHYKNILEYINLNPGCLLKEISFLSREEKKNLLEIYNNTNRQTPARDTAAQLIDKRAGQIPDAIALTRGTNHLSYRQLEIRSNRLAHHLLSRGIRAGILIGICMERSMNMVIGILGIMKAGGAYIPIDPQYPAKRIDYMLEDSRIGALLTGKKQKQKFTAGNYPIICPASDGEIMTGIEKDAPPPKPDAHRLVYIIYTSGSSGRPKGVGVYHKGFSNLLDWFIHEFDITGNDSVLLISSLSFDLTQKNIFAPLIAGGRLHLLASSEFYDPGEILDDISNKQVTWINCTPSVFYSLIDNVSPRIFKKLAWLRYLFLGGEPISIEKLSKWMESDFFKTGIVNTYGPTECTDIAAYYRLDRTGKFPGETVPIGKPVYNVKLYILGPGFELLPVGVPGEIFISGTGIGAGYINDAARTHKDFTANPFNLNLDKGLYKTGDLGKYLPDGNIAYLGRDDQQVKIRGFRIELKEIETRINKYEPVKESIVRLRENENAPGIKRLLAYVVPGPAASLEIPALRKYLRKELPDYMVPDDFILMDRVPLSPNGKLDPKRLPLPGADSPRPGLTRDYEPPRSPVEKELSSIIIEKTGLKKVGIHDNLFFLGIHSLLAAQVILRAREQFAVELPIYTIFMTPTIAGLAGTIMKEKEQAAGPGDENPGDQNPGDEIQRKMAAIWGNILGLNPGEMDVTADFFQLGGNSIKALLMIPEIAKEYNVNLLIMDVYEFNTIEKISRHIHEKLTS